jgi:hypothetical protein
MRATRQSILRAAKAQFGPKLSTTKRAYARFVHFLLPLNGPNMGGGKPETVGCPASGGVE